MAHEILHDFDSVGEENFASSDGEFLEDRQIQFSYDGSGSSNKEEMHVS